jgi:hypothetical protein
MREMLFVNYPLICREIADLLDMPTGTISETMSHYNKQKPRKYFVRLKPKSGKAYRYKIAKIGRNYLRENSHSDFLLSYWIWLDV